MSQQKRPMSRKAKGWIAGGIIALIAAAIVLPMTFYTVPDGHVAVVKAFSKAVRQEPPGFQTKTPFVESVEIYEVRERKNTETLNAATQNQLPATAVVSVNWTVNKESAMDLFVQYGGLEQFEERILDPRIRSAAKAALSRFRADEMIRDRNSVVSEIAQEIRNVTERLPVNITDIQLENVDLPEQYMTAILEKEKARENAERQKHSLEQQRIKAQETVQTAEADRDSNKAIADGNAYRTITEATAEADAIELINAQLAQSATYVELVKAKAWNGQLPTTMLTGSDQQGILYNIAR